jgi:hypothetical protein
MVIDATAGAAAGAGAGASAGAVGTVGGVMTGASAALDMPSFSRMLLKNPMVFSLFPLKKARLASVEARHASIGHKCDDPNRRS